MKNMVNKQIIEKTRDKFGLQSVYYLQNDKSIIFTNNMSELLKRDNYIPEIDKEALLFYMGCGYCPDNRTILKNIYKILPSENIILENGIVKHNKYWLPLPYTENNLSMDYWIDNTWAELQKTTKTQIQGEKVGIALSGGIDSSLIAATLRSIDNNLKIIGYSLDYGNSNSELVLAEKVAKLLNIEFRVVKVDIKQIMVDLEQLQLIYDEPLIKYTFIPTYYLAKEASREVDTIFTGDGGDELFIGYRNDYWIDPLSIKILSKLGIFKRPLFKMGNSICKPMADKIGLQILALASELLNRKNATHNEWQYRIASRQFQPYFSDEDLSRLFGEKVHLVENNVSAINESKGNNIEKISHAMIRGELPIDLMRLEKASLATGVKFKSPLLDMVDYAMNIPISIRYQKGITKYLLRQIIKKYNLLSSDVITSKKKIGLTAPIKQIIIENKDYFEQLINQNLEYLGINSKYIRECYPPKTYTQALKAWNLLSILLWIKVILRGNK